MANDVQACEIGVRKLPKAAFPQNLSPSDSCSVFKKPITTCQWDLPLHAFQWVWHFLSSLEGHGYPHCEVMTVRILHLCIDIIFDDKLAPCFRPPPPKSRRARRSSSWDRTVRGWAQAKSVSVCLASTWTTFDFHQGQSPPLLWSPRPGLFYRCTQPPPTTSSAKCSSHSLTQSKLRSLVVFVLWLFHCAVCLLQGVELGFILMWAHLSLEHSQSIITLGITVALLIFGHYVDVVWLIKHQHCSCFPVIQARC